MRRVLRQLPSARSSSPAGYSQLWDLAEAGMSVLVFLYAACFSTHIGRLSFFLGPWGRTAAIGIELMVIAASAAACVVLRLYWALVVGALLFIYIVAQSFLFAHHFGTEVHLASQSGYFGWLSVLVFAPAFRLVAPKRLINLLFSVALIYSCFYLLLSLHVPGFQPPTNNQELLSLESDAGIGRASRFVILSSMVAFGVYVSMARIVRSKNWFYALTLGLCAADVWLSYSRVITLMIIVVSIGYLTTRNVRLVGWICMLVFVGAASFLVAGLAVPTFHPFDVFGREDLSAVARAYEYEIVRALMANYWAVGVGFTPGNGETSALVSFEWFYSLDVGAAGVFFESGLVGLVLLFGAGAISALPGDRYERLGFDRSDSDALTLTGAACTVFGVLWPELWSLSATIFGGLFLAAAIVAPAKAGKVERPWSSGTLRMTPRRRRNGM